MKTITTNNRTLLFVEVPSPSEGGGFRIETNTFRYEQYGWKGWSTKSIELPSGNYRFIATTDTINLADKIGVLGGGAFHSNSEWDSYFQAFLKIHSITGRHAIIEIL